MALSRLLRDAQPGRARCARTPAHESARIRTRAHGPCVYKHAAYHTQVSTKGETPSASLETLLSLESRADDPAATSTMPALLVAWSRDQPERMGEVFLVPPSEPRSPWIIGRGSENRAPGPERLTLTRQRPGQNVPTGELLSPRLSRQQLRLVCDADGRLDVQNQGRRQLHIAGQPTSGGAVHPGDVLEVENALLLYVIRRPALLPALTVPAPIRRALVGHPFGAPDRHGMVGESPVAWALRNTLAFAAARRAHVLLLGASGTGKELAAAAIHGDSERRAQPFVARNAATLPDGLIDAELFGNTRNYPNPGMPERPGLIGAAERGTLFLDEIGELSSKTQAHLLRIMDNGDYQRLGESRQRRADIRMIAATNRSASELKHDVLARFAIRIELPDCNVRREDIPLLARHLGRTIAREDPGIAERFFDGDEPRFGPALVSGLLRRDYKNHVRELSYLLWQAMATSRSSTIDRLPELPPTEPESPGIEASTAGMIDDGTVHPASLTRTDIENALREHHGVRERVWRALGLRNRFQLARLMKKYGL